GTERHGDFRLRIGADSVAPGKLRRDRFPERHHAFHRRVLIVTGAHGSRDERREGRIDVVVRKALAEVERAELARTTRHHGEDRGADLGQLAAHAGARTAFRYCAPGAERAALAAEGAAPAA